MSHMAPADEHKSQLLIILGVLFTFLTIFLLLSAAEREALSFKEAKPVPRESEAELTSLTHEPTNVPSLTPTAYSVALPEVQKIATMTEVVPSHTPSLTATLSPTPSPSLSASPTSPTTTPSVTATPGLRRPTRVPRPTPR